MALKTPFIGNEAQAGAPITPDLMNVKVKGNLEDLDIRLDTLKSRVDNLVPSSPQPGAGGGLTQAQVDARILIWARSGNTQTIPEGKLPISSPVQRGIIETADENDADTGTSTLNAMTPFLTTRVVNAATTGAAIKTKLEGLSGAARLAASAIKDLPSGGGGRADYLQEVDAAPTTGLGTTYPAGAIIRTPDSWLELVHDDDADAHGVKIDAGRDGNYFGYNNIDSRFKKIGEAFRETDQKIVDDPVGGVFTNTSNGQVEVFMANDALGATVPGTIYVRFYRDTPAEASAFLTTSMTRSAAGDITTGGVTYRKYVSLVDVWDSEDEQPSTFYARFFTASPATNNQTANPLDIFGEYEWHQIDTPPGKPVQDADVSHDLDFVVWETDHAERRPVLMQYQDDADNKFFEGNVVLTGNVNANIRIYQAAHPDTAERGRISIVLTGGHTESPFIGETWDKIRWRVGTTGAWANNAMSRDTRFSNAFALLSSSAWTVDPAGLSGTNFPNGVTIYINPGFANGRFAYSETESVKREKLSKDKLVEFVTDEMAKNPARILQRVTSLPATADDGTEVFLIADQVEDGQLQDKVEDQLTLSGTSYSTSSSANDHTDLVQWFAQSGSHIHYLYKRSDNGNVIVIGRDSRTNFPISANRITYFGGREFEFNSATNTFGAFVRNWIPGGDNVDASIGDFIIHLYGEFFLGIESNWYYSSRTDDYIKVYRFNESTNRLVEAPGNKPVARVNFKNSSSVETFKRVLLYGYQNFAGGFVYNGVLYLVVQGRPSTNADQFLDSNASSPTESYADRHKLSLVAYDIDNTQGGPRFTFNYDKCIFYFYEWLNNNDEPQSMSSRSGQTYRTYLRGSTFYITNVVQNGSTATANIPLIAFDLSIGSDGSVSATKSDSKTSNVSPGYPIGFSSGFGPSIIASNISNDLYLRKYLRSLRSNKIGALENAVSNRRGIYVREGSLWSPVQRDTSSQTGAGVGVVGISDTPKRVTRFAAEADSKEGEEVYLTANYAEARGVNITPQEFAGTELDGITGIGTRGWYAKRDAGFEYGDINPELDSNFVLISNRRVYVVRNTLTNLTHISRSGVELALTRVPQAAGTKIISNPAFAASQPDVDYYTIGGAGLPAGDWDFIRFKTSANTYIPASVMIVKGYYWFDGTDWQPGRYNAARADITKDFKIQVEETNRRRIINKADFTSLSGDAADTKIDAKVTELNLKTKWYGTQAQFDAISVKDVNTEYNIYSS